MSGGEKIEAPDTGPAPDVKSAVAGARELVRDRKTGRMRPPRGPGGRGRRGPSTPAPELDDDTPAEVTPPTETEIADASGLGRTVWDIAGPMVGFRALTDEQSARLGRALAPVLKKYGPSMSQWWGELNLALVVVALARETRVQQSPAIVDDTPAGFTMVNEGEVP